MLYLSCSQSWHPQTLVLGFHSYGSRPSFKGLCGKWMLPQIKFSLFKLLWKVCGNVPKPGILDRCSYSEKLYESRAWPDAVGSSVFQESTITLFSQNRWGKEDQSKSLRRQILFGLAFLLQFVMANTPVTHNALLNPWREWRKFKLW